MAESLCDDCPIRQYLPGVVDVPRINPEIKDDRDMLAAYAGGAALLSAIKTERPERCQKLREVLPKPHRTKHHIPLDVCPEVGLIELFDAQYNTSVDMED